MAIALPDGSDYHSMIKLPATLQKLLRIGPKEVNVSTLPPNSQSDQASPGVSCGVWH